MYQEWFEEYERIINNNNIKNQESNEEESNKDKTVCN